MNRPDLMALVGQRVTITGPDPTPGPTFTFTGKLAALTDQPSLILDLDDGQRRVMLQYRCKVVRADDTTLVPCLGWSRTEPHDPHRWTTPTGSPVRCPGVRTGNSSPVAEPLGSKVLAMLHEMIANLNEHIDQRAAKLAQPLIDEARSAAADEVKSAQGMQQRAEDLAAELRRQIRALERRRDEQQQRADQAEAALVRVQNLRDKWLAWPSDDMHHAAGLMLAAYLDGEDTGRG